jgi:hypothetical protein
MKSVEEEIQKNKELLIKKELDEEKQKIKLHLKSCQNCKAIEELHKLCDKYKGVKRMQFIKDSILLHLDCKGLEIEICNTCEFKKYVDPIIDEFSRDSNDDESFGKLHHVFKDYFDCDRFSSCGNPVDLSQFSEY